MYLTCCTIPARVRRPRRTATHVTSESLCPTCSALSITTILRDGLPKDNMVPLGSLIDVFRRANQCRFCHLVTSLLRYRWCLDALPDVDLSGVSLSLYAISVGVLADPDLEESKRCHRFCIGHSGRPTEVTNAVTLAHMDLSLDIQLLEEDAHKFRRGREVHGRRIKDTVDIKQLKAWITLCEKHHGEACASVWWMGNERQLPPFVWMVDVKFMCLVRAPSKCRYLALSYVWGVIKDDYWTTMANIEPRTQSAGLDLSSMPATILDSIHLTKALGERYLWVDALCIIQDSLEDKNNQIHAMEIIFSKALLTIVAAGGEGANARLPGFSAGSRHSHQHIEVVDDLHLAIPLPSLPEAIAQTIWNTRGWTFQELLLSRRRLFFTKYQVYFECAEDLWCEDLVAESKKKRLSFHPNTNSGSVAGLFLPLRRSYSHPDCMTSYNHVAGHFTRRHLTYPSDVLHAITALTNAMTKAYRLPEGNGKKAFRYGMPIRNLEHSLLWQPTLNSVHARRVCPDIVWPSWAWPGWTGTVYYTHIVQLMSTTISTITEGEPAETLVANWYIVDDHQQLIRLEVKKISFIKDSNVVVPARYLTPEGDVDKQRLVPLPPAGILVFRTQCASLRISKLKSGPNSLPHTIFHVLSDVRQPSARIGRIILPSSTPSPTVLEFIVLSRSSGMPGLYDDNMYGKYSYGCMLHVMAVKKDERDVRVRERIGLGVIVEQAWLECGAEVETVLLG